MPKLSVTLLLGKKVSWREVELDGGCFKVGSGGSVLYSHGLGFSLKEGFVET